MRDHEAPSKASLGLVVAFASALAVATSTAAFRDTYSRPDEGKTPEDSLGTTEASPGFSQLDYRELDTSGGFPTVVDVAHVEANRLVVAGRIGTTNPAFAVIDDAASDPSLEVDARFLFDDLNTNFLANSLAIFLRGSGVASDGTINVAGLVLLDLQANGFYFVRGVVKEGEDPVIFATGFIDPQSFAAADVDGDGRLESGEPFHLKLDLDGAWFTFSFDGVEQVTSLYLADIPVPPNAGRGVLLGRNRVSSLSIFWTSVAFDDVREGRVVDEDQDGSLADQDCDDHDPAVHPGAEERCNGLDDDCDGVVPPEEADADGDGVRLCAGDCNDANAAVHPGALEVCNGVDDDCDGAMPEKESDADGDGSYACGGDCDDADPNRHPGAPEKCNGRDDDCDGVVPVNERDSDGDGVRVCAGDCNDGDSHVGPRAVDIPGNAADENCDGRAVCDPGDPWRNHGQFMDCVNQSLGALRAQGKITADEARRAKEAAERSNAGCGHGDDRGGNRGNDRDGRSDGHGDRDDRSRDSRSGGNGSRR